VTEVDRQTKSSIMGYSCLVKLLAVGDSGAGKSNLLLRYFDDTFRPAHVRTIGQTHADVNVNVSGEVVRVFYLLALLPARTPLAQPHCRPHP
jgi:GTPase SAR1 family protein